MLSNPSITRRLFKEIHRLKTQPPEGIRITTSDDNILDVTGIIAGPVGTPYEGGYFRIAFNFTEEFPSSPPKCRMLTKIFHPNVSSSGEICVNTLKKDWKSTYGIEHILVTVKCLLIYPNPESALDEEAGRDLQENYDSYFSRAKLITKVHATPKIPPPEFDIPSAISKNSTTSANVEAPTLIASAPAPLLSVPQLSGSENDPSPTNTIVPSSKPRSKGPAPLVSIVSSPPLQTAATANTNMQPQTTTALTTVDKNVDLTDTKAPNLPSKAVSNKRTASTTAAGADKRKKALKRL